jgi:hypothetical protein
MGAAPGDLVTVPGCKPQTQSRPAAAGNKALEAWEKLVAGRALAVDAKGVARFYRYGYYDYDSSPPSCLSLSPSSADPTIMTTVSVPLSDTASESVSDPKTSSRKIEETERAGAEDTSTSTTDTADTGVEKGTGIDTAGIVGVVMKEGDMTDVSTTFSDLSFSAHDQLDIDIDVDVDVNTDVDGNHMIHVTATEAGVPLICRPRRQSSSSNSKNQECESTSERVDYSSSREVTLCTSLVTGRVH